MEQDVEPDHPPDAQPRLVRLLHRLGLSHARPPALPLLPQPLLHLLDLACRRRLDGAPAAQRPRRRTGPSSAAPGGLEVGSVVVVCWWGGVGPPAPAAASCALRAYGAPDSGQGGRGRGRWCCWSSRRTNHAAAAPPPSSLPFPRCSTCTHTTRTVPGTEGGRGRGRPRCKHRQT